MEKGARAMRKSTRPAVEPPNLARVFQIPDIIRGWGHNGSNGNLLPGTILGGKTTPLMMIPGRNPKEVLDLPVLGLLSEH